MDRRRLVGPPNSITPVVGISSNPADIATDPACDPQSDKFFIQAGNIDNANGSCYMEIGNGAITLACSVFGPRPINNSFINKASFSVETKFLPNVPQPSSVFNNDDTPRSELTNVEQKLSSFVETSLLPAILLEKYPKSTVDVFVSVIACAEEVSLLRLASWMVNCSSVALVNAEIEVRDVVTSASAESSLASFMTMADDAIVGLWLEGDADKVDESLDVCLAQAQAIRANINQYLLNEA
ncbi:exosome complex component Mtr3p [Diutina catenulata]